MKLFLQARKKLLPKGKVPLVMAVIDSVEWQGSDASVCLKDKSGKQWSVLGIVNC